SRARRPRAPACTDERNALAARCLFVRRRPERARDLEALAVLAREQTVGVLVVDEPLGLPVERQRAADAVRDVREVRQRRREVPFVPVAVEQLRIAGADRVDEVLIVRVLGRRQTGRLAVGIAQVLAGPFLVLRPEVRLPLLAGLLDPQPAFRSI